MSPRIFHYDWWLLGAIGFLLFASAITLLSIAPGLFYKQLIWIGLAAIAILGLPMLNLKAIFSYRWVILGLYLLSLISLLAVSVLGTRISGAKSWILLGDFQIQPSEFVKIAIIILFSAFFASRHVSIKRYSTIIASFVYFIIPGVLVLVQPDLGTVLILFGIWFGYLLVSEIPFRYVLAMFAALAVIIALAWSFGLQTYQKERIIGLFKPDYDPLGINYSVIQSKIAIGSAGFFGKGFGQGTQSQLGFLTAKSTDFAFAAFTEEWGLLGAFLIISAFLLMIYRILRVGLFSDNNFFKFVALGTAIMMLMHFTINLGSDLGLFPVVGVSFPFLSYGGSNLLTLSILVGTIQYAAKRRSGF